ncbi:ShlB/FhaC/HecB family hemolysin secretion/activation protein [Pelistega sp. NLN82]|uniref:ShlB/FhaC/HecB family hemolysin secretion/activation protein n=1 Tax=Pelistega ratti TaxID=2652177 RepID=A0A6L9Y6V5_9BURK|nr:ShlB/FhaC/HecB family hemolysin secretion/activation protein [Pelistega ratti]NEN76083.1 ShlB/FhaC/HecB family hemolysin secretion/activation protein [Pelistega ratti]
MLNYRHLLFILGILGCHSVVLGQSIDFKLRQEVDTQHQQQQKQLDTTIYTQQVQIPDIRLDTPKDSSYTFPQQESPCFPIHHITLTDYLSTDFPHTSSIDTHLQTSRPSQFQWVLKTVYTSQDFVLPHCIGAEGINVLLRQIQNRLIEAGYVTTRVVAEPQDLRSGQLILTVIPGKVGDIQLQDHSAIPFATRGTLWFAMPLSKGDILNIRDIEQGLENLKRVPSSDANIELVPSEQIGETDIMVTYQQRFPFHLTLGLDDAGFKATGRLQGSVTFSWDNVLTLNDMFYISGTRSFRRGSDDVKGDYGSKNISLYYSIPWKNYLLTLSGSRYYYHQTVAGAFESYTYSGKSQQIKATLSRLLMRGSHYKTYMNVGLWAKQSSNYINNVEVAVQRRRTAGWEVGFHHTQYIGDITLQLWGNYKRGTGARHALKAPEELFGEGTSRMKIITGGVDITYPFKVGQQLLHFNTAWNGQYRRTPLVQQDKFSIGGRYTVRGFDGELTLSGESGWLWRNELAWNVNGKGHELYVGIDKGVVHSHQEELQVGNRLVGGVIGVRGNLWGLQYDYFVGTPLKKPKGFKTSHITTGFNMSYRF